MKQLPVGLGFSCETTLTRVIGGLFPTQAPRLSYELECWRKGKLEWKVRTENLVTNEGITDLLNKYFMGSGYVPAWFVGLITGPGPVLAITDKASSHPWAEFTQYSEATRPQLVLPPATTTSVSNSASKATFTCTNTANATISGMFVISDGAKGGGVGVLYSEAPFTQGDKLVFKDDVLAGTITLTGVTQ